jgi:peptidoglycan/LPS O-acetylase OafA/YrhL
MKLTSDHGRIAGLDGLRAIAVLFVFLHHTGLAGVNGGFVGVDIFFVLSGYLITMILSREFEKNGKLSFSTFYLRRARRLYPALIFLLVILAAYSFFFKPMFVKTFPSYKTRWEVLPALFYYMNWVRAFGGYDAVLTGHTWSLAIEEQFYLIWPIIITLLFRLRRYEAQLVIGMLIVAELMWRSWLVAHNAPAARVDCGFDTHSDGILMGAFMALSKRELLAQFAKGWHWACVYIFFLLTTWVGSHFAVTPFGYSLTAIAAAVLIAKIVTGQQSTITRVLEWKPLAGLGKVSYGFYLWHYPVIKILLYSGYDSLGFFFGSSIDTKNAMLYSVFAASLLLTLVSWWLLESPILNYGKRRRAVAAPAVVPEAVHVEE